MLHCTVWSPCTPVVHLLCCVTSAWQDGELHCTTLHCHTRTAQTDWWCWWWWRLPAFLVLPATTCPCPLTVRSVSAISLPLPALSRRERLSPGLHYLSQHSPLVCCLSQARENNITNGHPYIALVNIIIIITLKLIDKFGKIILLTTL